MTSRNENVRALMISFRSEKMVDLFFDANRHLTMFLRAEKGFYGITLFSVHVLINLNLVPRHRLQFLQPGYQSQFLSVPDARRRRRDSKSMLMVANVRPHPGSGTAATRVIVSVELESKKSTERKEESI